MEKDKSKLIDIQTDVIKKDMHSGLIRTIIGSILFFIFFSSLISGYEDYDLSKLINYIIITGVFLPWLLLSLGLVRSGLRRQRLAGLAEKYLPRMKMNDDGSILYYKTGPVMSEHNSTALWSNDRGRIERDLLEMIQRGYLPDAAAVEGDFGVILINKSSKQWRKGIYLNKEEMDRNSADAGKVNIAGLYLLWVFFMALLTLAATNEDNKVVWFVVILLILLVILRHLSVFLSRKHLRHAKRYGQVLEESITGKIPLRVLAEQTDFDVSVIKKDINWLCSHGILLGCHLEMDGEPLIILDDVVSGEAIFEVCECSGCLNTTQVRAGRVAKCRYCARLLEAPIILSN